MNIGNTCYLNASLQILFMLNKVFNFGHWVSKDIDYSHVSISDLTKYLAFRKFLYLSTLGNISGMDLDDFVTIICSIDSFFLSWNTKRCTRGFPQTVWHI